MRLKVIGIQMQDDKHGKKLMTPKKNTFIENIRESALGKMVIFLMVRPCNMSKKGEDDLGTIWEECRKWCKDSNMTIMFKKWGIRFLVNAHSNAMVPHSLYKENFSYLNIHQFGPQYNEKKFMRMGMTKFGFYSDVNSSLFNISLIYKRIEEERRRIAENIYVFFAAIGDKNCDESFLHFNERYPEYEDVPTTRECIKASMLLPYLLGVTKKSSRNKLIETLSIYPYDNTRYRDELVERHIDLVLENKLYDSKKGGVDDDEVNRVGNLLDFWLDRNIKTYNGSMLQHACHYLQTYCKNYE